MFKIRLFPSYIKTQLLIKYLNSKNKSEYKSLWNAVWNLRGTSQEPVDWQNPNKWIPECLLDTDKEFALMILNKKTIPKLIHTIHSLKFCRD